MYNINIKYIYLTCTVKWLIIGKDLFGEIGELKKFAKINLHQMNNILRTSPFFQYYRQIKSSPSCDIFKTAKYNSHQHFSFYSIWKKSRPTLPIFWACYLKHTGCCMWPTTMMYGIGTCLLPETDRLLYVAYNHDVWYWDQKHTGCCMWPTTMMYGIGTCLLPETDRLLYVAYNHDVWYWDMFVTRNRQVVVCGLQPWCMVLGHVCYQKHTGCCMWPTTMMYGIGTCLH